MAAAPAISAILIIFTGLVSIKDNFKKLINDKWNLIFILASLLMIFIVIIQNNELQLPGLIVPLLNNWNKSLSWIGLCNWIPLFFSYFALQNFIVSEKDRIVFSKCLIAGSFPIIISGFSQLIFGLYGPFEFLNGFIIWFQKPIEPMEGISSVFSNQNYAGAWFCIIFPFCLASFLDKKNSKLSKYISLTFLILISTSIVLTSSRSAWLGLFSFIPLMLGISSLLWIIPLSLLILLLTLMANGFFVSIDIQELLRKILPRLLWLKFSPENYTFGISRFEIWERAIFFIAQKPLLGWGAATFPLLYYSVNRVSINHSHNLIFELAISYGIPITVLIFGLIFSICITSFIKIYVLNNLNKNNFYNRAWFSSFLVLLLIQMFDIQYFDGRISLIFWILLAGLRQINKTSKDLNFSSHPFPIDQ